MNSNPLTPVYYTDTDKSIALRNFADTIVYDRTDGGNTLCAIRFGGYSEAVAAMERAIQGGGTIEADCEGKRLVLQTLLKRYRKKLSHNGVYAECTLIAGSCSRLIESSVFFQKTIC